MDISLQEQTLDKDNLSGDVPIYAPGEEELSLEVATQWQLMWWKFRKHKLAMFSAAIIILYYLVAIFAEFFAPWERTQYIAEYVYAPPQPIHFFDDGKWSPHVNALTFERDPQSFKKIWTIDTENKIPISLFVKGPEYKVGLHWVPLPYIDELYFTTQRHLIGAKDPTQPMYLFGADKSGRDILSRTIFSTRISLSVGLAGVGISLVLGIVLGGISGLIGGWVDNIVQRVIEIVISVPDLPIMLAIAASVPLDWPVEKVYFIITIVIALRSWTGLARVVRGKFLSLREDDFILASRLDGASQGRLIFRHMLPSFYSHIIASLTLALPGMILAETALSFLGLGLRPPAVSWGVMLQETQKVAVLALYPWLLWPAAAVIVVVLAFNFLGDGLRDAADPY
ncbi:MAG: ABC transporter permease [Anaerolineae bacterium]|nr:ABC transporter permease [Anaerolineae bacterium]